MKELTQELKVTRIDKNGEEITKNTSYIRQFIDTVWHMARSLLNRINNLSEGIHNIKCKFQQNDKNVKYV